MTTPEDRAAFFESFDAHLSVQVRFAEPNSATYLVQLRYGHQTFDLTIPFDDKDSAHWMKLTLATVLAKIASGDKAL